MTDAQLAEIDAARKKREDELLLLLLLLIGTAVSQSIAAGEVLDDPEERAAFLAGVSAVLIAKGTTEIAETMADAHADGFQLFARGVTVPDRAQLVDLYRPTGIETVTAMLGTLGKALEEHGGDVAAALVAAGYSRTNSGGLELGAERNIVTASNAGFFDGAVKTFGGDVTGLRHVSVIDDATSAICEQRNGLQLPIEDPYWLLNYPSLHGHCRSNLEPIVGPFDPSTWRPTVPPAVGFGRAPASVLPLLNRRKAA